MAGFDLRGELQIGGTWVDCTGNLLQRHALTHTRGRRDQGVRVDPSTCQPLINNTNGQFSPDNPLSPYYGQFGRNTPFRLSARGGRPALDLPGRINAVASTPDAAALDIVGDIDIRVDATLSNWTTYTADLSTTQLIGKLSLAAGTKSWVLGTRSGAAYFEWSSDGSASLSASSTVPFPVPASSRLALRVTLDVNNGASGRTVTFYTAPTIAGPWTQLGDQVVQAGITSLFNSTTALRVGRATDVNFTQPIGRIHKAEVRSGINGTIVAAPDFSAQTVGATSFVDAAGLTWTVTDPAAISDRRTRLTHELAAYPTSWHPSGKHVWVSATTAGILRRLGRGNKALDSTLRRRIPRFSPLAYWPMEEGQSATQAYSPIAGVQPLKLSPANWGAATSLASSNPLPMINSGTSTPCVLTATVPNVSGTLPAWSIRWVYRLDNINTVGRTLMRIKATGGTVAEWTIQVLATTNTCTVIGKDADDTTLFSQALNINFTVLTGQWVEADLQVKQIGGNVQWHIGFLSPTDSGTGFDSTPFAGTIGKPTSLGSPASGYSSELDGMAIGHITVWTVDNNTAFSGALTAWASETAGRRMQRLADEEDLPVTVCGVIGDQTQVGAQLPDAFLTLLQEAADADGGILYEDRNVPALRYRDRASMYNQDPVLVLDYTQPGLGPPLEPTGDDDATLNDVTVTRVGGSSGRAVLEEGPLSVQAPPNGVGRYDTTVDLNLFADEQTDQAAGWLLHLGTYEGRRYPQVRVMMHRALIDVVEQALTVDVGDKIVIRNPPPWLAPGDIELIVQGYEETFSSEFEWDIVFNCTPGQPWTVGVVNDVALGKADTDGCQLAAAVTATDTTTLVATTEGPVWTSNLAETPFDWAAGGEVMRVVAPGPMTNANPFFDTGIGSWSGTNATISPDTTLVRPHPYALGLVKVTPVGGTFSVLAGTTLGPGTAGPNGRHQLSAWVYSPTGWASGLQLQANWFNSSGTYLSTTGGTNTAIPAGTWTQLLDVVTSPAGADRAQVLIRQNGTPSSSDVYYAWCVQISRISASTIYDEFGRSVTGSWGAADSLQTWTLTGGTGTDFSVTSGYGRHINTAASAAHHSTIAAPSADFDIYCDIAVAALSTGASQFAGVLARFVDLNNLYESRVEFTTGNAINLSIRKRVTSTETQLGTFASSLTNAAGAFVRVRFQGTGASLRARIWAPGGEEPTAWHVDVTDAAFSAAGSIGMKSVRNAGNTNASAESRFENFALINPQIFTVARSVNGISKPQAAGEGVRLAQPAVAAL
ncbi:hypothetical protein AB0D09_02655 [Streptomyces sp. NPDC049097]|uniref:hypothetical protein n=1 Tax=Streptomyces sp. NPDC049097 TaxID=3155497 RepID=UPI0034473087